MSRKVEGLKWAGGEHDFRLGLGEIEALQQRCDAGPEYILQSLGNGTWLQDYLFQTLRQGLIGAGMHPADAARAIDKVKDDDVPLRTLINPATVILAAALVGVPEDEAKKSEGEDAPTAPIFPEENGGSPTSTVPPP